MSEISQVRRGRPTNEALGQTIVDAACELFVELGFQATTLDKVAKRAKISNLSIYRHFENKEALFSAAIAARCHQFAPQAPSKRGLTKLIFEFCETIAECAEVHYVKRRDSEEANRHL